MSTLKILKKEPEKDSYYVKLPFFEGPFDLLYHLINKEEINIWEIPLAKITEEYMRYLQSMQELQVDLAGEFLVMAASLLYLKSKLLLPPSPSFSPEEVETLFFGSKEELVHSLLEYKRFKVISNKLKEREEQQKRIFLRSFSHPRVVIVNRQFSLYPHDLEALKNALLKVKKKNNKKTNTKINLPEEISFNQKLEEILTYLKKKKVFKYCLEDFLDTEEKKEIILTFFVLLELAKRGRISLTQEKIFGKISVQIP